MVSAGHNYTFGDSDFVQEKILGEEMGGELRGIHFCPEDSMPEPCSEPEEGDEPEEWDPNRYHLEHREPIVFSQADQADTAGRNFQELPDTTWKAQLYTPEYHLSEDFNKYKYFSLRRMRRLAQLKRWCRRLALKLKVAKKHGDEREVEHLRNRIKLGTDDMDACYRVGVKRSVSTEPPQWWKLYLTKDQVTELRRWIKRLRAL